MLAMVAIFALILSACAPAAQPSVQPKLGGQPIETFPEAEPTDEAQLIEQVRAETEPKNIKTEQVVVPVNIKKGSVGDFVVFGVMFNQVNKPAATYFATVTFIEGRDKNNNRIEVDKDTVRSWIRVSETERFALPDKGSQFVPVSFRIREEIKPGVSTVLGSYQFEIQFHKVLSETSSDEVDGAVKQVYVKVE